jgi:hypothetical protein
MATLKYALKDKISCVDLNGRVYRVVIQSISNYAIARQLGNIEIQAQQYPAPYDTIDADTMEFYICTALADNSITIPAPGNITNIILWDAIIDHTRTVYLTAITIYKLEIIPTPPSAGIPTRDIGSIINNIKTTIANNVSGAVITYTDITDAEEDVLERMQKAVDLAFAYFDEVQQLESIRPLIQELLSIDFGNLTTETMNLLTNLQTRLSLIDAGGTTFDTGY